MDPLRDQDSSIQEEKTRLPIVDVSALLSKNASSTEIEKTAEALHQACTNWGFFYIANHNISTKLQKQLDEISESFFELPLETKLAMKMKASGNVWRGYFPLNAERTAGKQDSKEGIYFGNEYVAGCETGTNLFPKEEDLPNMKPVIMEYLNAVTELAFAIVKGISISLGLPPDFLEKTYLSNSTNQFLVVKYPPEKTVPEENQLRVGPHTDYGFIGILKQDNSGGLQVKTPIKGWIDGTPVENTFVCIPGDSLEAVSNGLYPSAIHRVKNVYTGKARYSFPFFFEPSWETKIEPLPVEKLKKFDENLKQFDENSHPLLKGTYGDYFALKMATSYPQIKPQ